MTLLDSPYAIGVSANQALLDLFAAKFHAAEPGYFRHTATLDLVDLVVEVELKAPPTFRLGPVPATAAGMAELGLAVPEGATAPEPDVEVRFDSCEVRTFAPRDARKGAPLDTLEVGVAVAGALVVSDREASIVSLTARVEAEIADRTLSHVLTAMLRKSFADKVQGWALPRVSHVIGSDLDLEVEDAEVAGDAIHVYGSIEPSAPGLEAAPPRGTVARGADADPRIVGYVREAALQRAVDGAFTPPEPRFRQGGSSLGFGYELGASASVGRPEITIRDGKAEAGIAVSGSARVRIKTPLGTIRVPLAAGGSRALGRVSLRPDGGGRRLMLGLELVGSSLRLQWKPGRSVIALVAPIVDLALGLLASAFAPLIGEAIAAALGKVEVTVFEIPAAQIPGTDMKADVSIERVGFERDCAIAEVAVK